jgi:hypothetical protein
MIGKIATAIAGKKIAERYGKGAKGAMIGALLPMVAKRAFGPLGLAIGGGYLAKKYYDGRKRRTRSTY